MAKAGAVLEQKHELGPGADKIVDLDPDLIDPSPFQERKFGKAETAKVLTLAENIARVGQRVPVEVRAHPKKAGRYQLTYGERRVRACKHLGIDVDAVVVVMSDSEAMLSCFIENYEREDLTPLQEALGFQRLLKEYDPSVKTRKDLAELLGLNPMHVSRRMQLVTLTAEWKKRFSDPDSPFATWGASLMEYVAKFPPAMQEEIAKGLKAYHIPGCTLDELQDHVSQTCHELSSAPWKKDDAELYPEAGACTGCPLRSDVNPDLFDAADFGLNGKGKTAIGARCLNVTCYESKRAAWAKGRREQVLAEHPKAVRVTSDWNKRENKKLTYRGDMDMAPCKKSAAGAKPVFFEDGKRAGQLEWMKPHSSRSNGSSNGSASEPGKPTPLKKRREVLERRRRVHVLKAMAEYLDEHAEDMAAFKHLKWTDMLAFAAVMGSLDRATYHWGEKGRVWKDYETARKAAARDKDSALSRLFFAALQVLASRLAGAINSPASESISEAEPVHGCKVLGLKLKDLEAKAAEEVPEPHSWGSLNADGTSKKKPAAKTKSKATKAPAAA